MEDMVKLVKTFKRRIPKLENSFKESMYGRNYSYEKLYLPLAILDDILIDMRSVLREKPAWKGYFKNTMDMILEIKLIYLKYIRLILYPDKEGKYLNEWINELESEKK
jgi:hypothetical protein